MNEKLTNHFTGKTSVISEQIKQKRLLVDAVTGKLTQLSGELLEHAIRDQTVITRSKFYNRKLVDALTGKPTLLMGESLEQAKKDKTVIRISQFIDNQPIDLLTGKPSLLTGEALEQAKKDKTILSRYMFNRRKRDLRAIEDNPLPLKKSCVHMGENNETSLKKANTAMTSGLSFFPPQTKKINDDETLALILLKLKY